MELINEFIVPVSADEAWKVLTDVETIAPCLPGAQLQEIEGDEYRGVIKVKVGPITAQYKGRATFVEKDDVARRAVLQADGRDTRGQGNAAATITAELTESDGRTRVVVNTDLTVTGRVAQFGRGVMADVSAKLMAQFAENLQSRVLSSGGPADPEPQAAVPEPAAPAQAAEPQAAPADEPPVEKAEPVPAAGAVRRVEHPEAEPVDLAGVAGVPIIKRLAPVLAVIGALIVLRWLIRRRR
ncbi:MAG: carbon monoxide dehydrogenase [Actinobacteria bacterium]|nr:MAG: carbon monoxide dehydrogenase [Actinomycetota bacterium]RIK04419.1 MAG: carbon monoxide dehydrogenase [Acidobacteriota bacterium]